jgi:methyl-accepting chemotaxis protein
VRGLHNIPDLTTRQAISRNGKDCRGFAVVAQEVKALASQTAKATEEISAQVAGMQTSTTETAEAIKAVITTIGRVSEIATEIATAIKMTASELPNRS